MGTRDRAQQLCRETELLRVLVATLVSEVDVLVPAGEDGRRTRVAVLARMITTTAADVSDQADQLGATADAAPADGTNVVPLRRDTARGRTHPVFAPLGRPRTAHRPS